jgi:membrane-bound lytic murein transglycosylase D
MIPVKGDPSGIKLPETVVASAATTTVGLHEKSTKAGTVKNVQERIRINGIAAIRAGENQTPVKLAEKAGVDLSAFLKWNDMSISDKVESGDYYLLGKKRNRAKESYHKVLPGETLWSISQQYAVQMKKLRKYNRLDNDSDIRPGMTLWLSTMKPKDADKDESIKSPVEVNERETFAWDVTPGEPAAKKESTAITIEPEVVVVKDSVKTAEPGNPAPVVVENLPADTLRTTEVADSPRNLPPVEAQVVTIPSDSVSPTPTNPGSPRAETHVVQPKETLYGIARQHNVGVMDLVNWNNLDLQQGIKPGQVIRLSAPREELASTSEDVPAMNLVHEVKPTDTVYSIARKYGVTIKDLMEWNNKTDFNLAVGEKLRIIKR